jgi:preprotein translocase subunit YajC
VRTTSNRLAFQRSAFLTTCLFETHTACSALVDLADNLICLPLRGIMQATFVGVPEDAPRVKSMLSSTIETVLNGDHILSIHSGIADTVYLGSRVIDDPPPTSPSSSSPPWTVDPTILGTSLSVVAVLGIMGVFLLSRRRKRRNQRSEVIPDLPVKNKVVMTSGNDPEITEQDESSLNKANNNSATMTTNAAAMRDLERQDQEIPSVDPLLLLSIATTRTASETITDTDESLQDNSLNTARTDSPLPSLLDNVHSHQHPHGGNNNGSSNNRSSPPSVINLQPRPKDSNGAALIRPPPTALSPNKKPPLPNKPPTTSSSSPRSSSASAAAAAALSKPLKQQRRKKKRKKKPKMIRVNSRERVAEMETITEAAEEGEGVEVGDNNDEDNNNDNDSEYSWYSETDSNASSSRDVSPSRGSPVPSTSSSSEDQIMVQLQRSLDSPNQLHLLSCGSTSSKDDEDDDDDPNDSGGEQEIVKMLVASSSSSAVKEAAAATAARGVDAPSSGGGGGGEDASSDSTTSSTKADQSRGSSPVPSYWT